jgi:hypothetical protein
VDDLRIGACFYNVVVGFIDVKGDTPPSTVLPLDEIILRAEKTFDSYNPDALNFAFFIVIDNYTGAISSLYSTGSSRNLK